MVGGSGSEMAEWTEQDRAARNGVWRILSSCSETARPSMKNDVHDSGRGYQSGDRLKRPKWAGGGSRGADWCNSTCNTTSIAARQVPRRVAAFAPARIGRKSVAGLLLGPRYVLCRHC